MRPQTNNSQDNKSNLSKTKQNTADNFSHPSYLQNKELLYKTIKDEPNNELKDEDFTEVKKIKPLSTQTQRAVHKKNFDEIVASEGFGNIDHMSMTSENFRKQLSPKSLASPPDPNQDVNFPKKLERIGRLLEYKSEEDNIICARFPHLKFCACAITTKVALAEIKCLEVHPKLFLGPLPVAFNTKELLKIGITHVLNVSSEAYTKRKYFEYLDIDVYDNHDEDIKKYFRISNRFIRNALSKGGKVLVHSTNGKSRGPAFILAYFINNCKINLKKGTEILKSYISDTEINHNFYKQLEIYDLEKLALMERNDMQENIQTNLQLFIEFVKVKN